LNIKVLPALALPKVAWLDLHLLCVCVRVRMRVRVRVHVHARRVWFI